MVKRIIIDAAYPEETRVAILDGARLQNFEREAVSIKQLKGNIYLAKITKVEPSLQSAFIEYGGDRHGFLPFSDIHPDYYSISDADRAALKKERDNAAKSRGEDDADDAGDSGANDVEGGRNRRGSSRKSGADEYEDRSPIRGINPYSPEEEADIRPGNLYKKYKIQDVIKEGQLVLVQVIKEERGNKGASMTTYISLAGKYCVLMSNSPNRGGVSKKIDNIRDRKALRNILNELEVPEEQSVIVRTAGVGKKPEEIRRDYNYLSRLWNSVREITLKSKAPSFIHAEDDVVKRAIRDVYDDEVHEVIIEGKRCYESVCNLVQMIMSRDKVKNVKLYDGKMPIFNKFRIEEQVSNLYEKETPLHSGGSIVLDHTEALVAIDVNSGKATAEKDVEETAVKTNIEAANEIARQLRLRDLAGLVVIDFIDMADQKNRRAVERALRDALQGDRARIQLGHISTFGLLEMSRQRLAASFFESTTAPCKHCGGTGNVRSVSITATSVIRAIKYACNDKNARAIHVYTTSDVIIYMMNFKKNEIRVIEHKNNVNIFLHQDDKAGGEGFYVKKRKDLTPQEKDEIRFEIKTGEVNKLGIEESYMDDDLSDNDSANYYESNNSEEVDLSRTDRGRRKRPPADRSRRKGGDRPRSRRSAIDHKKSSLIGDIFDKVLGGK